MKINYQKRILSFEKLIKDNAIDSFFMTKEVNVAYLSGFKGHDSMLFLSGGNRYFVTDSRYLEEANDTVDGFEIILVEKTTYETIKKLVRKDRAKRIGFESMDLPYEVAKKLKTIVKPASFIPFKNLIEGLRSIKDGSEITLIKDSIRCIKGVFGKIAALIKPGITEEYIGTKIIMETIARGGQPGFEPIVASGPNSSKPHARPSPSRINKNSYVMVDLGCNLNGYNSDLTRMVLTGEVKSRFKKIYDIVHAAQEKAIAMIKPGVKASMVDASARDYINNCGFGKYFGHACGHGVGMEVHEKPAISKFSEEILKPGMVFTIEPAIYIPKFGGVRIEDMALVTDSGYRILTRN